MHGTAGTEVQWQSAQRVRSKAGDSRKGDASSFETSTEGWRP